MDEHSRLMLLCFEVINKLISAFIDGEVSTLERLLLRRLGLLRSWLVSPAAAPLKQKFSRQLSIGSESPLVNYCCCLVGALECVGVCVSQLTPAGRPLSGGTEVPHAGTLSSGQRSAVQRAVEHVLALSLLPCLPSGVGVAPERRSRQVAEVKLLSSASGSLVSRRCHCLHMVSRLLDWTENYDPGQFRALLFSDPVLTDILAFLALLAQAPSPRIRQPASQLPSAPGPDSRACEKCPVESVRSRSSCYSQCRVSQLSAHENGGKSATIDRSTDWDTLFAEQRSTASSLIGQVMERVARLQLARALLLLQQCSHQRKPVRGWMVMWCWRHLYQITLQTGGVTVMTEALLQFWGQDRADLVPPTHIQAAAKLLVCPPVTDKLPHYFGHLAREVLSLLTLPRPEVRSSCVRVAGALVQALCSSRSCDNFSPIRKESTPVGQSVESVTFPHNNICGSVDLSCEKLCESVDLSCEKSCESVDLGDGPVKCASSESSRLTGHRAERSVDVRQLVDHELLSPLIGCLLPSDQESGDSLLSCNVENGVESVCLLFIDGMEPQNADAFSLLVPYAAPLLLLYTRWRHGVVAARGGCCQLLARLVSCWGAAGSCDRLLLRVASLDRVAADCTVDWPQLGLEGHDEAAATSSRRAPLTLSVEDVARAFAEVVCTACQWDSALLVDILVHLCHPTGSSDPCDSHLSGTGAPSLVSGQSVHRVEARYVLLCAETVAALVESDAAIEKLIDSAADGGGETLQRLLPTLASLLTCSSAAPADTHTVVSTLALIGVLLTAAAAAAPSASAVAPVWSMSRRLLLPPLSQLVASSGASAVGQERRRVTDTARCLQQLILTNGVVDGRTGDCDTAADHAHSEYDCAMYQLCDPLVPVRGHAVIWLSRLLQRRDPVTWQNRHSLLSVFEERLTEEDSYVYLAAVRGLACLSDLCTDHVLTPLCSHYVDPARDTDTRLKLGESLIYMVTQLGDIAPHYTNQLLNAFLAGCRDPSDLVRSSSLSNLAQLCRLLRYSLSPIINEVLLCVSSLLDTDDSILVRRGASLVLCQILQGLDTRIFSVLEQHLTPLYRRLKLLLQRETDAAILKHANNAYRQLSGAISRSLAEPARRPLHKHIHVLRPPN